LADSSIKVDNTHDDARMIKILGTMSMKGDIRRMSKFIDFPTMPFKVSNALYEFHVAPPVENRTIISDTGTGLTQTQRLQLLEKALPLLKQERCEDYDSWIKCGIALKEFGAVGYRLWNQLSQRSSKYSESACSTKWGSFPEESGISIGSIIHWAREDSGQTIRLESSQPGSINRSEPTVTVFSPNGNLVGHKARLLAKSNFNGPDISIGLPLLDKHTWGLLRGEIFTVGARTGIGKTSFAVGVTKSLLSQRRRVLFFSTEMSSELIINRLLSSYTGLIGDSFKTGNFTEGDHRRLDDGYTWLESIGESLNICDLSSPSIATVKSLTEKYKPDVVVFDHVQHIGGGENVRSTISEFVRGLKDIARDFNCSVLVLSQLRRMFKDPKTGLIPAPQLSDLKECGTIEEESGQVLLLSEMSTEPGTSLCVLMGELAKNRFGECTRVGIEFDRATANFKEIVNSDASQ
jgi:KaiC/GvpD/RAD55 family RecA-like ATPase